MQKKAIKICVNGKKEVLLQADLYVDIKFDKQIIMKNVLRYLLIGMVVLGVSACQQRELNTRVSNTTGWS